MGDSNNYWVSKSNLLSTLDGNIEILNASNDLSFSLTIENVTNFARQRHRTSSNVFYCRGLPFQLLVESVPNTNEISAFIHRPRTSNQLHNTGLNVVVRCKISILDQIDVRSHHNQHFVHCFSAGDDFGYENFISIEQIQQLEAAGLTLWHDNSMVLKVLMRAEAPHCADGMSKLITGHVGIANRGTTCYMSSLLQVLYFTKKFRTSCHQMYTEPANKVSTARAIQTIFGKLETSHSAVSIKTLGKSLGWSRRDAVVQHDVQEKMYELIDLMENGMKNTILEPIIPNLFYGETVSTIKCRDLPFTSEQRDIFRGITISVDTTNNILNGIRKHIAPEIMDGANMYHADDHGLQVADKQTQFVSLPPVLILHLLRFKLDQLSGLTTKLNSYCEFDEKIDLAEFFAQGEAETHWTYSLFAVLAHSGTVNAGHYVAYINPDIRGQFYKFNDSIVSIVSPHDAIDANFGSELNGSAQGNAYMLVYVRDSMAEEIFELNADLFQSTMEPVEKVICDAKLDKPSIHGIVNDKDRLSKEAIERMENEAKRNEDEKQNETVSAKNALESYCFND